VPELATANAHMQDRMKGSGRTLPPDEREARQQRVIDAATRFILDQNTLHPLNPEWDNTFLNAMATGDLASWDKVNNDDLSALAGKSTHEVKAWMAACAAMSVYGNYLTEDCYYRPIPEWIAGFGLLNARRT
jgi:2,3-dihydroxyphenylpropionate 1,2-dioxygenase